MIQSALLALRFGGGLFLGFAAPGYFLAGVLGAGNKFLWSFPLSMLLLFLAVFLAGLVGLPITGTGVAPILILITLALAVIRRQANASPAQGEFISDQSLDAPAIDRWIKILILSGLSALAIVLIVRTILWPLSGWDTEVRWDFLAIRMLELHRFAFYPPISPADYRIYFYTDGMPPLISFCYWWLYRCAGGHVMELTTILVGAQFICTLCFTYDIGRRMHSPLAGLFSAGILGGSALFVRSVAIGQETGLTALSAAAMFYAVIGSGNPGSGNRDWRSMILTGLAGALGALSREYGCVMPILGALAVIWIGGGAKNAAILCGAAILAAGPWYLRNTVRAGNPFYGNRFGPFHINPVHTAMLEYYAEYRGILRWDLHRWAGTGWSLLRQAPLQLTIGPAAAVLLIRKWGFLVIAAAVMILIWLYSIGYTAGGREYSMRVLSPALVVLSVLAGVLVARCGSRSWCRLTFLTLIGCALLWSVALAAIHPFVPGSSTQSWSDLVGSRREPEHQWFEALPPILPPGSRILCDDTYMQAGLTDSGLDFVPVWSPEVEFLAGASLAPQTARKKLIDLGIHYVVVEKSINGYFLLDRIRFYREDLRFWKLILKTTDGVNSVYELPPDPAAIPSTQ